MIMEFNALVIGGGIAGMESSLTLADSGYRVLLVDTYPSIGGKMIQLSKVFPTTDCAGCITTPKMAAVSKHENITLMTYSEIKEIVKRGERDFLVKILKKPRYVDESKCIGCGRCETVCPILIPDEYNYGLVGRKAAHIPFAMATPRLALIDFDNCTMCGRCERECPTEAIDFLQKPQEITVKTKAIIIATGFKPYKPKDEEFGYGLDGVLTLPQFERLLALNKGELRYNGRSVRDVAFIYCVGSRNEEHEYCSRYCCTATINATLSARRFGVRSYHIYRDIRTYGKYETYYEEAGKNGLLFFRYTPENPPEVRREGKKLIVKVKDQLTFGEEIEIPVDLVVLSTGMELAESDLYGILRIPFSRDGFLQEVHPKLRPVETAIGGVLIAGTCQFPKDALETAASASAAAAKAATYLLKGYTELEPFVIEIDPEKCTGCGECVEECPAGAITLNDVAVVNEALCKGCGACGGVCPTEAINLRGYYYDQLRSMIDALSEV